MSRDALVDAVWGEKPPRTAVKALQVHIVKLRQLLGVDRIVRRDPGYLLAVELGEVDADRFVVLAEAGRGDAAAGRWEPADASFGEALALCRGAPLAGFDEVPALADEAAARQERQFAVEEEWVEAVLNLGRHAGLVAGPSKAVADNPLRERLRVQLMLALHGCGRHAEALESYRQGRAVLVEGLGIEPGTEVRDLEHAILTGDPRLAAPHRRAASPAPASPAWASARCRPPSRRRRSGPACACCGLLAWPILSVPLRTAMPSALDSFLTARPCTNELHQDSALSKAIGPQLTAQPRVWAPVPPARDRL